MTQKNLALKKDWDYIHKKYCYASGIPETDINFKEWFFNQESLGGVLFSPLMYARAYNIQRVVLNEDRDHFICIAGKEGNGKSTLSIQLACTLDPTFCLDRICFTPLHFVQKIKDSKPGQVFILDEGNLFLFGRQSMGMDNILMVKLFALMRQRNLIVIINVPNFFTLDNYVRCHRVDTLLYVHRKGKMRCFVDTAIRIISHKGAKYKNITSGMNIPPGQTFQCNFFKAFPHINDINEETYKNHKHSQFVEFLDDIENTLQQRQDKKLVSITEVQKNIVNINKATLIEQAENGKLRAKQIGNKWYFDRDSLVEEGFTNQKQTPEQETKEIMESK